MAQEPRMPLNIADRLKFIKIVFNARQAGAGWKAA